MGGIKPGTIFTDQCAAMLNALAETWPETNHRLCIWHIYQNAASNLQHVFSKFPDFIDAFSYIIYNYEDEANFEILWDNMLEKYGLRDNDWLEKLYKKKEKWALVYGRQHFSADILSTQRSESMNSTLKGYVNSKQNLLRFLENFDRLVDDRRYEELQADFRNNHSKIHLSYAPEILKHARDVYTHKIFKLFEEELSKQHDAKMECLGELDGVYKYEITPYMKTHHHLVTYTPASESIFCSCKKFEFAGILFSHILKVFTMLNVFRIPDKYIKKRWTKGAKRGLVEGFSKPSATSTRGSENRKEDDKAEYVEKYQELCKIFTQLTTKAARDDDAFELAKSAGYNALERVDALFASREIVKKSTAPTSSVVRNTIVSKVTKKKTVATSLHFEDRIAEPIDTTDGLIEIGDNNTDDVVIQGLKAKETKVRSGKRPKGGLEQAVKKTRTKKNKNSSQDPSQGDTQEKNGHNSNKANKGASNVNVNPFLQPSPLCPPMFSFPQVFQNNSPRQPIWNPPYGYGVTPYSSFGQAVPYLPTSQPRFVNPNLPQQSYQNSTHVTSDQPNSGSMIGLLHTQMRQAQADGSGMHSSGDPRHVNDEYNTSQ